MTDISIKHPQLLKSQKEKTRYVLPIIIPKIMYSFVKGIKASQTDLLDLVANVQEISMTKKPVELHQKDSISNIQTEKFYI